MTLSQNARAIWHAGVAAVRANSLIDENISLDSECLNVGDFSIDCQDFDRVLIVGAGKAVASMTIALDRLLSPRFPTYGWVNVPAGTIENPSDQASRVCIFAARPPGVNEPTDAVIHGTQAILKLVRSAGPRDLCLIVLSGGGSALLTAPVNGITLADKLAVTRHLSGSGANIGQVNTVRKQISEVKGGGLARACRAGQLVTLVLSDVLGDPLDVIASGPTVNSRSSADDALQVLRQFDPNRSLPSSVYRTLENKTAVDTVVQEGLIVVLGNNATAVDAAGIRAESLGYSHAMTAATRCEGSAESVGIHHAELAVSMLRDRDAGKQTPDCLITGGEPTVQLAPANIRGQGGRNMHLVLAAMQRLSQMNLEPAVLDRIVILSGGTDGEDGPTDAAGAILTGEVWREAIRLQLDPVDYLARSDSYSFFQRTGGLLVTGPTHTNVCDIRVVLVPAYGD